jgi:2-methylcitrate dehydratase
MTLVQQMASFIHNADFDELSGIAREQIKIRILGSLGATIGAIGSGPIRSVRAHKWRMYK